jgi:hypothetical protein
VSQCIELRPTHGAEMLQAHSDEGRLCLHRADKTRNCSSAARSSRANQWRCFPVLHVGTSRAEGWQVGSSQAAQWVEDHLALLEFMLATTLDMAPIM